MEITENLDVREISPRVINGWSDVRFEDDETTAADFFEAVRQAIFERANAVIISLNGNYPSTYYVALQRLAEYPITQNTLSYEIFNIIENAISVISYRFICGINDSSSEMIGYKYRGDLEDFPFVLKYANFGINDDIAFFKRPNMMPTWNEMKSSGYAYRLMSAINAMTSMKIGFTRSVRDTISGNKIRYMQRHESFEEYIERIKEHLLTFCKSYENNKNAGVYIKELPYSSGYCGFRIRTHPKSGNPASTVCNLIGKSTFDLLSSVHPGGSTGADCLLRDVFVSLETYSDFNNNGSIKDSYVENIEFLSLRSADPLFCPHNRMIYVSEPRLNIISSFSPSVLPPDPNTFEEGEFCYQYGQRFRFNQYYDFGIPGGFRFRKDT